MTPLELFWAGQEIYITRVYLPVIIVFLVSVPLLLAILGFGMGRRTQLWRLGKPDNRSGQFWTRLKTVLAVALLNVRIVRPKEMFPGAMHSLIFGGTIMLFLGKIVRLFAYITGLTNPPQAVYLYASWVSEVGAALAIAGGLMAVYRRYIVKPPRLDTRPDDTLVFIWVFLVILTGYMAKGFRIAASDAGAPADWLMWSPLGYVFSGIFPTFVTEAKNEILVWHRALIHTIPAVLLLGYIWLNRSRLQHILLVPLNIFFRSLQPKGALEPIDLEKAETFGTPKIEDFTWKQIMDLEACVRCGRCQDNCPAHFSGKKLNPKKVIQDLKDNLHEVYPVPLSRQPIGDRKDMISEAVTDEVIWDCTTCRACQEACPVYIEHVPKIVDMRRNLAMERSSFPESVQDALKCLGTRGHPYRGTTASRTDWTDGLEIKTLADDAQVDILYWVGCSAALEQRNVKVAQSVAKIMKAAGINFGILGAEETCCGDPARRLGDEYLYQTLCQANIEIFKSYNVKKIVTACPHCYNTLKNEYPQFGGSYEVVHHTQFISDLIRQGKIKLNAVDARTITYHDSCYLGRYNDVYREPRQILQAIGGLKGREMPRSFMRSFCCGGGGGHMWMEEEPDKRINSRRVQEIVDAKVDMVATACPYCLVMFEDALKAKGAEETIKARDVSELVVESMLSKESPEKPPAIT